MLWADIPSLNLTLLLTSLAAVLLAGALLILELFASQRLSRQAPVFIVLLLAAVAVVSACVPHAGSVALAAGTLAILMGAAWATNNDVCRRLVTRLYTPRFVWGGVLLAGMIASRYLAAHMLLSLDQQSPPPVLDLEDVPIRRTQAMTDSGKVVTLFHFKMHSSAAEIKQFIASNEKDLTQIIRMAEPNSASNCHGWVFTGGQYGIRDPDVPRILIDNAYAEVAAPREGDLAIYMQGEKITHSGIVRIVEQHAPLLVESKWGPFGVYLHGVKQQPFPGECKYFRSMRSGHHLTLQNAASESAVALEIANGGERVR